MRKTVWWRSRKTLAFEQYNKTVLLRVPSSWTHISNKYCFCFLQSSLCLSQISLWFCSAQSSSQERVDKLGYARQHTGQSAILASIRVNWPAVRMLTKMWWVMSISTLLEWWLNLVVAPMPEQSLDENGNLYRQHLWVRLYKWWCYLQNLVKVTFVPIRCCSLHPLLGSPANIKQWTTARTSAGQIEIQSI